ncbi:MAG: cyclodeaminase/cyclohydrolase family protein [Firmicutes bacterium]|nr:cyclodeaminase/cyclohydrolase family protein [Bacillota bacterium]
MSFAGMALREFLGELGASTPAPGGGSASAVAGAMGLALVSMVAGLTPKEAIQQTEAARLTDVREKACALRERLLALADEDTAAFNCVMRAYRLPKSTDTEKQARREAIQLALKGAVRTPLEVLEVAAEGMRLARVVAERGNSNAASDVGVAALLLDTAMGGAIFNIQINLAAIKDTAFVADIRAIVEARIEDRDELRETIIDRVLENIGGE